MEELGRLKLDFFKQFLELPNGIPDESVFRRVLQCITPYHLQEGLERWLSDLTVRTRGAGAKRVSAKRRMIHATLNEDFLYQALFTE
jgi:hypothetical protein